MERVTVRAGLKYTVETTKKINSFHLFETSSILPSLHPYKSSFRHYPGDRTARDTILAEERRAIAFRGQLFGDADACCAKQKRADQGHLPAVPMAQMEDDFYDDIDAGQCRHARLACS